MRSSTELSSIAEEVARARIKNLITEKTNEGEDSIEIGVYELNARILNELKEEYEVQYNESYQVYRITGLSIPERVLEPIIKKLEQAALDGKFSYDFVNLPNGIVRELRRRGFSVNEGIDGEQTVSF